MPEDFIDQLVNHFIDIDEVQGPEQMPIDFEAPTEGYINEPMNLVSGPYSVPVIWRNSPNITQRSQTTRIAIVSHQTSGSWPGCLSWLCNPEVSASAHFIVNRAGQIDYLINLNQGAIHAGAVVNPTWFLYQNYAANPNQCTIGIEHETPVISDGSLTEPQYQATLKLQLFLSHYYDLPIDTEHFIGHNRIDSVNRSGCPGPGFPWERLLTDLRRGKALEEMLLKITNQTGSIKGIVYNNKSYVPVRDILEGLLGWELEWDGTTKTATATPKMKDNVNLEVIGSSKDVKATLVGGKTLVFAKDLVDSMGGTAEWSPISNSVIVTPKV